MFYCFVLGKEQFTRMIIFASIGHTMMMVSTKGFAQSSLCLLSVGACFCLPKRRAAATFWLRPYRTLVSPRESPDHVCRYLRPNGWFLRAIKTRKTKKNSNCSARLDTNIFLFFKMWKKGQKNQVNKILNDYYESNIFCDTASLWRLLSSQICSFYLDS